MDPKLYMLFFLIGGILALSNITDERVARLRRWLAVPRRRRA